jgi:hypothetical protein
MADCLADPLLRPGAADRPPVQVSLTVVAPAASLLGGDGPGDVDGESSPRRWCASWPARSACWP